MRNPIMKCGHAANAIDQKTGKPSCAICAGLTPDALIVDDSPPVLSGRVARCGYYGSTPSGRSHEGSDCKRGERCMCEKPSDTKLPFFSHNPDKEYDSFYCGCWGWD